MLLIQALVIWTYQIIEGAFQEGQNKSNPHWIQKTQTLPQNPNQYWIHHVVVTFFSNCAMYSSTWTPMTTVHEPVHTHFREHFSFWILIARGWPTDDNMPSCAVRVLPCLLLLLGMLVLNEGEPFKRENMFERFGVIWCPLLLVMEWSNERWGRIWSRRPRATFLSLTGVKFLA